MKWYGLAVFGACCVWLAATSNALEQHQKRLYEDARRERLRRLFLTPESPQC